MAWQCDTEACEVIGMNAGTASDAAAHYIRSLIFAGILEPGDRLPVERELADQLSLNRVTLRIAKKSLEATGFLTTSRGVHGGSRVTDAATLRRLWADWMRTHAAELRDTFEYWALIETKIAALAAERRTEDDLHRLDLAVVDFGSTVDSVLQRHGGVHSLLADAAHNRRLARALDQVRGEIFQPVRQALDGHLMSEIQEMHRGIVEAVRAADAGQAEERMRAHIEYTQRMFFMETR